MLALLPLLGCTADPGLPELDLPDVDALTEQGAPDLLTTHADASAVESAQDWQRVRRPELQVLLSHYVYGRAPTAVAVDSSAANELSGMVELDVALQGGPTLHVLVFVPDGDGPFPVVLGLNKCGNHTVSADERITRHDGWAEATCDAERGSRASYWDVESALQAGVAVATLHQSELDADDPLDAELGDGVHALYGPGGAPRSRWGTIAAWSWGLCHALDGLQAVPALDAERVYVFGHSRRGKAALWASATDERFAGVWAHQSGTGGQTLSRSYNGESVEAINTFFPHWFNDVFPDFGGHEERLPVDQHFLIAMSAPRPVLLTDGDQDSWADPEGARLASELAAPAWDLLGATDAEPEWALRPGEHYVGPEDWATALEWMGRHAR